MTWQSSLACICIIDTNQKYLYVAAVFENIFPRRLVVNMSDWGIFISISIFSNCICKSNKYLRKYKENLYNLRFLVEFATNNTYLWGLRMSTYHMRQVAGDTPTLPVAAHWGLILCKFNLKQCKNILINCDFIVKIHSSCHLCHPFCHPSATT